MRITSLFAALLALFLGLAVHRAEAGSDSAIQAVIEDQLAAFGRDDLSAAFEHASPGIQGIFETPENFGRMVRNGYPMVWRPARWEMLGVRDTGRGPVQTVLFEDRTGTLWEADYLMEEVDGEWRINGVELRKLQAIGS